MVTSGGEKTCLARCPLSHGIPRNQMVLMDKHLFFFPPGPKLLSLCLPELTMICDVLGVELGPGRGRQGSHLPSLSPADSCSFALHARGAAVTRFSTPGFPNSPYPAHARCQWVLRGDADSVLSLTFRSFDVAPCDEHGSDLVTVYDSLSPMEPHAVVR